MASRNSARADRSHLRAWFALVGLSLRRQARARMMIWVALGLLAIAVALVALQTWQNGWSVAASRFRYPREVITNVNPFFKGKFEIREKTTIEPPIVGGKYEVRDRLLSEG